MPNKEQGQVEMVTGELAEYIMPIRRSITVTRTYSLGDYKNIKFSDTISDIPEHLAINHEFMNVLRYLQLISVEKAYFEYVHNASEWQQMGVEDALSQLDGLEHKTMNTLKELLNGNDLD